MVFKNFRLNILWRVLVLAIILGSSLYLIIESQYLAGVLIGAMAGISIYNLVYFIEGTQRKVTFFLESIDNSDFTVKFSQDDKYGKTFKGLNTAFNKVLEAFRQTRSEKEEHLQYLNTVVQSVRVGLLSFDQDGKVELLNSTAIRLLGTPYLHNIGELAKYHPTLLKIIKKLAPGGNVLLRQHSEKDELQLSITATELRMRGKSFKLVSLQNIQSELQQKELEAWQNLTKVLRHEIMNSITPITSNIETMNEMMEDELSWQSDTKQLTEETTQDIAKALKAIEKRSKGLLHFVDAYRSYSSIPQPNFSLFKVQDVLERVVHLFKSEIQKMSVDVSCKVTPPDLELTADAELIENVVINLFKNALEAVKDTPNSKVELTSKLDHQSHTLIEVQDNGPGIIPEAVNQIFIPFYTTKKSGSGIGLSLSRQIMQLHNGNLTVDSEPEKAQTMFTLRF